MTTELDLARRCAQDMYAEDLASQKAGITITDVEPGRATARMTVTDSMINGHEICHGGYIFLLADTAFAFACNTYGQATVAQGCDIVFVRPAHRGSELVATAAERLRFGRNGIYDVTVTSGETVIAEFRGRSRVIGGPLPAGGTSGGEEQE